MPLTAHDFSLDELKTKGETTAKVVDLVRRVRKISSPRRMKMTGLEVVGALIAAVGTALILTTLLWLDDIGARASSSIPQPVEAAKPTPHRKAA
jgi:hypothetical protein